MLRGAWCVWTLSPRRRRRKVLPPRDEAGGRGPGEPVTQNLGRVHQFPPTPGRLFGSQRYLPAALRGTNGYAFPTDHNGGHMSLLSELSAIVGEAFAAEGIDPSYGGVVVSQRPELAQFQANGAMAAAKVGGSRLHATLRRRIAAGWRINPVIAKSEVAGPGFINLIVTDETLADTTQRTVAGSQDSEWARTRRKTVLVDYAGPNVAKAMHVGHLRATIIGDSLARLFALRGNKVIRDPHFGDWGLQMGLVIAEIERRQPELPYFDPNWTGPYPAESPVTLSRSSGDLSRHGGTGRDRSGLGREGPPDHRRPAAGPRGLCRPVATHEAGFGREPASRLRPARGRVRPLVWRVGRRRTSRTSGRAASKPRALRRRAGEPSSSESKNPATTGSCRR